MSVILSDNLRRDAPVAVKQDTRLPHRPPTRKALDSQGGVTDLGSFSSQTYLRRGGTSRAGAPSSSQHTRSDMDKLYDKPAKAADVVRAGDGDVVVEEKSPGVRRIEAIASCFSSWHKWTLFISIFLVACECGVSATAVTRLTCPTPQPQTDTLQTRTAWMARCATRTRTSPRRRGTTRHSSRRSTSSARRSRPPCSRPTPRSRTTLAVSPSSSSRSSSMWSARSSWPQPAACRRLPGAPSSTSSATRA